MTAKYSANKVLKDIAVAGATAVYNIENCLVDQFGHTQARLNVQGLGNLGSGDIFDHAVERTFNPVTTKFFKLSESVFN